MTPIQKCIVNKDVNLNPIWLMRQAGRYLPEFRQIRSKNKDFIKLCLSENLASEITLQPIKRFNFDAAIIFSDILMLPYGLNQKVEFEKNFGPKLGEFNLDELRNIDEVDFSFKLNPVYRAINITASKINRNEKDFNYTLALIKQYEIIKECYHKAHHYINLASNSLSIFKECKEKTILENLTSFSLSRDF